MRSLYIHIPFCKSRCVYCGFYSTTASAAAGRYVEAVCREWELRRGFFGGCPPDTIYIGGGTPSCLPLDCLRRLVGCVTSGEGFGGEAVRPREFTVECNPDDVSDGLAAELAALGVNRVSMGVQTFDDRRLRFLSRRHDAAAAGLAVERLRRAGIGNVSIDLIYGFPDETVEDFAIDVGRALALGVEHISAYALMIDEGTRLERMVLDGEVSLADEEAVRAMFDLLCRRLAEAGFEHYEISNFARAGRRSVHNSCYWRLTPYLGLGASAHSYAGDCRQWNVADLWAYIRAVEGGKLPLEGETLSAEERYEELVMLSLRTCEGLDLGEVERLFGSRRLEELRLAARRFVSGGLLKEEGGRLRLTHEGVFVSDMVIASL